MKKLIVIILLIFFAFPAYAEDTTIQAIKDGYTPRFGDVDYTTARDTDDGISARTDSWWIGQRVTNFSMFRAFSAFVIPRMISVSSCTLYVNGSADNSTTDFLIYIYGAQEYKSILAVEDYSHFDGRQTAANHDGERLIYDWNSSAYSADWNTFRFAAAGLDSVLAAQGDTLWIALISEEDFKQSVPTDNEYVIFDSSEDVGTEPYLSMTYVSVWANEISGVTAPVSVHGVDGVNIFSIHGVE